MVYSLELMVKLLAYPDLKMMVKLMVYQHPISMEGLSVLYPVQMELLMVVMMVDLLVVVLISMKRNESEQKECSTSLSSLR